MSKKTLRVNETDKENGKVVYNEDILKSIVGLSVSNTEGVKVKYKNVKKEKLDGIKINVKPDGIYVDVMVDVYYGANIPEVSYFIQQSIKHNVETMSKYKIQAVDVHVDDVVFKEETTI